MRSQPAAGGATLQAAVAEPVANTEAGDKPESVGPAAQSLANSLSLTEVGLNRAGIVCSAAYLLLGLAWVSATNPAHPFLLAGWFVALAAIGSFIPGFANQASLARAYLAAPALTYALVPGRLGLLAVVLAIAGLSDVVDGTIARRFDRPSTFGGGLDPIVDGVLLGAVAIGLALGGTFPFWLAGVIVARYLLPAIVGLGLATGTLSGFFGIGGGFLIVPALMLATGMSIMNAVSSSLTRTMPSPRD